MKGEVLRILRIANDFSIKDVTKKWRISANYLSEVEHGKKKISNKKLEGLLNIYNISQEDFERIIKYHKKVLKRSNLKTYQLTLLYTLKIYEKKANS